MKQKCVLFGTGNDGEAFYRQYSGVCEIVLCLDNARKEPFHGIKVAKPHKTSLIHIRDLIIVASARYYDEISQQLRESGKEEFDDYISSEWYLKKMALIHGNCHTWPIRQFLETCKSFHEQYYFYHIPAIHMNQEGQIDDHVLSRCSLFLHQDIRRDNPFGFKLSDDYLLPRLSSGCITLAIPNLYGFGIGFFPQTRKPEITQEGYQPFPFLDMEIDTCKKQGMGIDEIIDFLRQDCRNGRQVLQLFRETFEKLLKREEHWDIKISDYFGKYYRTRQLFYNPFHPTNFMLLEVSRRILQWLGYQDTVSEENRPEELDDFEIPIYPWVKKALGLEYRDYGILRKGKRGMCNNINIEEYIRQYCNYYYGG